MHEITSRSVATGDFHVVRRVDGFENITVEYPAYLTD